MEAEIIVIRVLLGGMESTIETLESAEKEIEELKIGMTEEEHQIFGREIVQQKIITSTETRELVEKLEKEILDIEKKITAIPIEN
ncbi:hypothetical protein BdWA1_002861 [Babesia duncani]|uniref:Uncharacterized protein n=1 Tax=Babesia duncani TaxID=323732 RepID=A0AAD9UMM4_9APIC|nr:hypothetical protein BdWA1_002861 [Babesia duncani]